MFFGHSIWTRASFPHIFLQEDDVYGLTYGAIDLVKKRYWGEIEMADFQFFEAGKWRNESQLIYYLKKAEWSSALTHKSLYHQRQTKF